MSEYKARSASAELGTRGGAYYPPNFQFEVVRSFEDGDRLFMHIAQNPDGRERWATMSLLQVCADGSGNMLHQISKRASMRLNCDQTLVGGVRELDPNEHTSENKALVREFVDRCFIEGDLSCFYDYVHAEEFISHNPVLPGGAAGFRAFVETEMERSDSLAYTQLHDVVGQANFVAVFSDIDYRGSSYVAADLFRVQAGRIVEHWDVAGERGLNRTAGNDVGCQRN